MEEIDDDLLSLSLCITDAYAGKATVQTVRKTTVTLPSGKTTWLTLVVVVSGGPVFEHFTMYRCLCGDGAKTAPEQHMCTHDHSVRCDPGREQGEAALVAMCAWRNNNIERHPETWAWFAVSLDHYCQIREQAPLKYTMKELVQRWLKWGFFWPSRSLLPTIE